MPIMEDVYYANPQTVKRLLAQHNRGITRVLWAWGAVGFLIGLLGAFVLASYVLLNNLCA